MTHAEAAAFIRCEEEVLERLRVAGDIVYVDIHSEILYLREDLLDYIRARRRRAGVAVEVAGREPLGHGAPFTSPEILTEAEAADFLRIGHSTVRGLRRAERIPHLKGKPARYLKASLLEWETSQEIQPNHQVHTAQSSRLRTNQGSSDKAALRAGILG